MGLSDPGKYEIDFRLKQKEDQFQQAIILAHGLRIDAIADDGIVMGNQPIRVTANVANRGPEDVTVKSVKLSGFDGDAACPPARSRTRRRSSAWRTSRSRRTRS